MAESYLIVDPGMLVKSMRDSGYKSTTHALAELIDNSIESGAESIEVFGLSERNPTTGRFNLTKLAVLDNGQGMDKNTLRGSLRYGHGSRVARQGIGRFGLGLPNSSMSQARCLDVWSWRSGISNAFHAFLSLDDVESGIYEIAEPQHRPLPQEFVEGSRNNFGDSGTLVVWSQLDRVEWKQASSTFRHTENLVGRIYRRFLASESQRLHEHDDRGAEIGPPRIISLVPLQKADDEVTVEIDEIVQVRPNDPLYLMSGTSCPEDFGPGPMFAEMEGSPFVLPIYYGGEDHEIRVRASYVRPHVRDFKHELAQWPDPLKVLDSGSTPWGVHAEQNLGISLIRAHREIQLDDSWGSHSDPRDRWWKIEVDFPTALDELFGVTNNKQNTPTFERLARFDFQRDKLQGENTQGDVVRRMQEEGDPRYFLLDLHKQIRNALKIMRPKIRASRKKRKSDQSLDHEERTDLKASDVINRREEEGHTGVSDLARKEGTEAEHRSAHVESLRSRHQFTLDEAMEKWEEYRQFGSRVRWIGSRQSNSAFFDVEPHPCVLQVVLNTEHPVYRYLWEVLHPEIEDMDEEDLRDRLDQASAAFRMIIYAWARYEEEQSDRDRRKIRDGRVEWGRYAEDFFFDEEDDEVPPTDLI